MIDDDLIRESLSYDPETGDLRWLKSHGGVKVGDIAGCGHNGGYRNVRVGGMLYLSHRLAWFLHYGKWPTFDLDHINGERADNRIANLRRATRTENLGNQRKRTGTFKGTSFHKRDKKWRAQIGVNGRPKHIGYFDTEIEAARAYDSAAKQQFGEFARLNFPGE